jgi:hypothetical protein
MRSRIAVVCLSLLAAAAHGAIGDTPVQASAGQPANTAGTPPPEATITFFNRSIFTFRAPLLGVSAADRAARAQTRLRAQLDGAGAHKVSEKPDNLGVLVQIDGATTFVVTPDDTDRLEQETVQAAAGRAAEALRLAVRESGESRNIDAIARATGWTLVATATLAALVWMLHKLRRSVQRGLVAVTHRHVNRLQLGGVEVLRRERLATLVQQVLGTVFWLLVLMLGTEWLGYVLTRFPYTRAWGELLNGFLVNLAARLATAVVHAVPDLLTAAVIFLIARFVTRVLHSYFERVQSAPVQDHWLDADVAVPTRRIAKVLVWLFAVAMAYPYLPGAQTEAFRGLSVLVGLMVSLGASNLVGQAASGLILTYGRVYRKGEYVRIAEQEGTVTELGIFATRLRTGLGEELTLSNSTILAGTTRNYSRAVKGRGFVVDTTVTIG